MDTAKRVHADHASGNGRIKAAYPDAKIYTTTAVDRALAPGGFLARDFDRVKKAVDATPDEVQRDEMRIFIATMEARKDLRPDVPLAASGPVSMAGRTLDVRVTENAVTDADVWVFDASSKVAVLGDLVTMPVPYFETACPDRWKQTLDEVWGTTFETAVPGHGRPFTRQEFDAYRQSFTKFVACARSDAPGTRCGAGWAEGLVPIIGDDPARRQAIAGAAEYYVEFLRKGGGKAQDCRAR